MKREEAVIATDAAITKLINEISPKMGKDSKRLERIINSLLDNRDYVIHQMMNEEYTKEEEHSPQIFLPQRSSYS